MIIKRPIKAKAPAEAPAATGETAVAAAPAAGGATIADRFKLDAPPPAKPKSGGVATIVAVLAAVVALGVAGVLTFILYQHWEFLKAA